MERGWEKERMREKAMERDWKKKRMR